MIKHLNSEELSIEIQTLGAEISSVKSKTGLEYIWQADPSIWGRHAPILFPIVGKLKDSTYTYEKKEYSLSQHGFARDSNFNLIGKTENSLVFLLKWNKTTLKMYPFKFELLIYYSINKKTLSVKYEVLNLENKEMPFSIGAHPAFRMPLFKDERYENYYLEFDSEDAINQWLLEEGLLSGKQKTIPLADQKLHLNHSLFASDAIVLKNLKSQEISIRNPNHKHGIKFKFQNFPYFGIWSKNNAEFVCLEPWNGITDSQNSIKDINQKEGIQKLAANESFSCSYSIEFF